MEALRPEDPPQVGAYRLLGRLGGGGMGTVFLGRTVGGRNVAVKLIRGEYTADEEFRRRFRQEVAAARRVNGRWTPPVLDADTEGGRPWVATAYVPGPDLAQAIKRFGPLPVDTVRTLGAGLAEGLLAVHGAGLVHRDLKPSNVLLSLDGPRMIDFGIARALDGTGAALTQTGTVIGSPGYMSPEQATGTVAGPPSDVFSLGAVLAATATGRAPFGEGPTAVAVMYRVLHEQPDLDGLPDALRDIVVACLNKDPAGRPTPQQIHAHMLPDPDATIPPRGWLPPATMPTLTVTLRQGKLGGAVGTFQMQGPDGTGTVTCRATIRLATAGPDRITVIATNPTGGAECQSSGSTQNMAIAQESAAALSLGPTDGPDTTPLELVKQN